MSEINVILRWLHLIRLRMLKTIVVDGVVSEHSPIIHEIKGINNYDLNQKIE